MSETIPLSTEQIEYLTTLQEMVPDGAAIILNQFRGDVSKAPPKAWMAHQFRSLDQLDPLSNIYFTVCACCPLPDGSITKEADSFVAGLVFFVDDVGPGESAKLPMEILDPLPPTALVETSPENYQAIYFFNYPEGNAELLKAMIEGFIKQVIPRYAPGVKDPGMAGINRIYRPPFGVNGKAKYRDENNKPWTVRLARWAPENRYDIPEIVGAFDISIAPPKPRNRGDSKASAGANAHFEMLMSVVRAFQPRDLVENREGKTRLHVCPFSEDHGTRLDGAAVWRPSENNGWTGAFKCSHGDCLRPDGTERTWKDFEQKVGGGRIDEIADELKTINETVRLADGWSVIDE